MNDSEWMRKRNEVLASWPATERRLHQAIVDNISAVVLLTDMEPEDVHKVLSLVVQAVERSMRKCCPTDEKCPKCPKCGECCLCECE